MWNHANGAARLYNPVSESWESFLPPEGFERNELFLSELRHLIAVARDEVDPLCTLQDGVRALKLAGAVHESSRTQQIIRF